MVIGYSELKPTYPPLTPSLAGLAVLVMMTAALASGHGRWPALGGTAWSGPVGD
jgi:hypothetical protein